MDTRASTKRLPFIPPSESILGSSPAWVRRPSFSQEDEDAAKATKELSAQPAKIEVQNEVDDHDASDRHHPLSLPPAQSPDIPSFTILPPSPKPFARNAPQPIPARKHSLTQNGHSEEVEADEDEEFKMIRPPSTSPSPLSILSTSPTPSALTADSLSILPQRLFLLSLRKESSDQCLRTILNLIYFSSGVFFSVTQTEDELSLIVEEDAIKLFPDETVEVCPGCWRAIQVYEGPEAIDCSGLIAMLSGAITEAGINVIYLSTFNTDLLLVDEKRLDEAYDSLKKTLKRLSTDGLEAVKSRKPKKKGLGARGDDVAMVLSPFPKSLSLVCMTQGFLKAYTHTVLKLLLSTAPFFSLTLLNDNEVVLVVDEDHAEDFIQQQDIRICVHPSRWRGIQIDLGSIALDESAVTILADILGEEEISIYYLSTYTTDFVLVEDSKAESAIELVNSRLLK